MRLKSGVPGSVKNLVFAANGPKPEIVLVDAVSNDIKIVKNEQYCLVYDKPILDQGLLWQDLIEWWKQRQSPPPSNQAATASSLLRRLLASLSPDSPPERLLFQTYYRHFLPILGNKLPALIPQVYLHYDPKTVRQLVYSQQDQRLFRQRMDFLLLFSNQTRIVLEVDGQQHYSNDGKAKPELYAQMVAEDRRIRLQGYEIYRFGGAELQDNQKGKTIIIEFFQELFQQHSIKK
jgi:very-short-patch-repair endonuclease